MAKKKIGYYQRQFKIARESWAKYSPLRKECFNNAKVKIEDGLYKWRCAGCPNLFALSEVQCDHIEPISKTIPNSAQEYTQLFLKLESDKLQILCKKHHNEKTKTEIGSRQKDVYIQNILKSFPSLTDNVSELRQEELKTLKKISAIIDEYRNGEVLSKKQKTYSTTMDNFLRRYNKDD